MGLDGSNPGAKPGTSGFNPYAGERNGRTDRPSDGYSDAELMAIYQQIQSGQCDPKLRDMFNKMAAEQASKNGVDGKPVVDEEGGMTIQP